MASAAKNIDIDIEQSVKQDSVHVLIVEDDYSSRLMLRHSLDEFGYIVSEAEDGKQALELYENNDFDIILIDLIMPVMDGLECVQEIKSLNREKYVPIIFLTGVLDEKHLGKCIDVGGDDFLTKPYNDIILKAKMDSWLRNKRLYDTVQEQKHKLSLHDEQHEQDLMMAREVINNFTYFNKQDLGNLKFVLYPMEILCGDIILSAVKPAGGQNILLADFTGHGLPAAIGSMIVSESFYAMTRKGYSIEEIAIELNRKLTYILPTNRFMSACLLEFDSSYDLLSVLNAGIPDVILYNGKNRDYQRIPSSNMPLGILPTEKVKFTIHKIQVTPEHRAFIYSDGIIEAVNKKNEMFGYENILKCIEKADEPGAIFYEIVNHLYTFCGGRKHRDDISLLQVICDQALVNEHSTFNSKPKKIPAADWNVNVDMSIAAMQGVNPIPGLVQFLIEVQGMQIDREKIYTVLTELYSNALEHGLLGLSSEIKQDPNGFEKYYAQRDERLKQKTDGNIRFNIGHKAHQSGGGNIEISIIDNGTGFDFDAVMKGLNENTGYSGRGISLVRSFCDNLDYSDEGRKVTVNYSWENN